MPKPTSPRGSQAANLRQIDKFVESARDLECDEDDDAFKAKFKKVVVAALPAKSKPHQE